ncbi:MAG TPA: hypothetical protein VFS67_30595 [Polyangiaceae bacterium]|nr:hypothetical protein [Polyangiaceae bacterium]
MGRQLGEISAAIVEENSANSKGLVARLEVQPNEIIEFYESAPGIISLSGAGAPAGPMLVSAEDRRGPRELWDAYAGGASMPLELATALEREELGASKPAQMASSDDTPEIGGGSQEATEKAIGGFCSTSWFSASASGYGQLARCYSEYNHSDCLDWWWNGRWDSASDVYFANTSICPTNGSLTLKVNIGGGSVVHNWTVGEDTYRWHKWDDADCGNIWDPNCWDYRSEVNDAIGREFQWRWAAEN